MKICLVRPPDISNPGTITSNGIPPLGLAYIASAISRAGHELSVVDAVGEAIEQYTILPGAPPALSHGLLHSEILERIPNDSKIIGISAMFSSEWFVNQKLVELIKKQFPNAFVVLGGEHASSLADYLIENHPAIDGVIRGEGEVTFVELADHLEKNLPLENVSGLTFRSASGIQSNPMRQRHPDINQISRPLWSVFPVDNYFRYKISHGVRLGRSLPIMASRGCPYRCTFCSSPGMWGTKWQAREPEDLIDEMQSLKARYQVTDFVLCDLTAIIRKDWIIKFCKGLIQNNLQITWQFPTGSRSEVVDSEVATLMYRSGCHAMCYAPESGSKEELKKIKKQINLDRMVESMVACRNANLKTKGNFVIGFPDSTWRDVAQTYQFILRLAWIGVDDIAVFSFSPYPGSELFKQLVAEGKIEISDTYFRNLISLSDARIPSSYCKNIKGIYMPYITHFLMLSFYAISFSRRPQRLFRFLKAWWNADRSHRLTNVLIQQNRRRDVLEASIKSGQSTVHLTPV